MHQDDDSSNSVTIRGGRCFLVQEGSAKVVPGTFGLTVVEPSYICVSCLFARSFLYSLSHAIVNLLASHGAGITAILDNVVHQDDDSSNSVTIRGGRRFLLQEGSAKVGPETFGLTVVEPS